MATQESYIASLNTLLAVKGCAKSEYWTSLINKAMDKALVKGSVQSTLSNPLAYFIVPLAGEGKKGRSHDFATKQFSFTLLKGWERDADKRLRGVDPDAIEAGLAFSMARKDSALGLKEDRRLASKSASENLAAREQAVQQQLAERAAKRAAQKAAAKAADVAAKEQAGATE